MPLALETRLRAFLSEGYRNNPNNYLFLNRNGKPYSVGKITEYGLWQYKDPTHEYKGRWDLLGLGSTSSVAIRVVDTPESLSSLCSFISP